jgi:hypothetical protein
MSSVASVGSSGPPASIQLGQLEATQGGSTEASHAESHGAVSSAQRAPSTSSAAVGVDEVSASSILPDDLKTKLNTLITNEVDNGNLTGDQADKLRKAFAIALGSGPNGDAGLQDVGKQPAPGPASPPAAEPRAGDGTAASTPSEDVGTVLNDFLKLLQNAQSVASSGYGARGVSSATAAVKSVQLINYSA